MYYKSIPFFNFLWIFNVAITPDFETPILNCNPATANYHAFFPWIPRVNNIFSISIKC